MESATAKPSSTVSETVSKFARVCRLRSIGVVSSENPNHHHLHYHYQNPNTTDKDDETDETECDGVSKSKGVREMEIVKLFDIVSALKLAYVELQEAHIQCDPEKIQAADELVVSLLEALCKIKHAYKERELTKSKINSSSRARIRAEIEVNERVLEELKLDNKGKDVQIQLLRQKLEDIELGNLKLARRIRKTNLEKRSVMMLNINSFLDAFKAVSISIHDFAKPLISFMKASGWDVDLAASSIEDGVVYSRRSHKKYAFEAYIARRMFHGMSLKSCNLSDIINFDDPIDALMEDRNSDFAKFCLKKYLLVVDPTMEASFFGNLDQRMFVMSGKHPRTPFYQVFARMAKCVWVLQGIAALLEPKAEIFAVKRGSEYSDTCMECVDEDIKSAGVADEGLQTQKVEFMVIPGFRIGEMLVKSRVYLSKLSSSSGIC